MEQFIDIFFIILGVLGIIFRKTIIEESIKQSFAQYEYMKTKSYSVGMQILAVVVGVAFIAFGIYGLVHGNSA